jgi:hypothetical protein
VETYVARAYQVGCMTREQIERIHTVENRCRYVLPNWNIQQMINLPEIKDRFCLPDDDMAMANHGRKLKSEIDVLKLTATDYGFPTAGNVDAMHSFDWAIYAKKDVLPFMNAGGFRGKKGRLEETV